MTKQELNKELLENAKQGNLEKVKSSIKQGADVNAKNSYGWTALIWSAREGHLEVVKYLIENGADIEAKDDDDWTALILSSSEGHLDIVKYLVEQGADVNAKNKWGNTALTYIKNDMLDDLIPYIYNYKFFEGRYNKLTMKQKHILFEHFMNNRELLEQVNPRKMKRFIPDINEYKNNL